MSKESGLTGDILLPNVGGQRPLESGTPDALASEVPDGMGFSGPLMFGIFSDLLLRSSND